MRSRNLLPLLVLSLAIGEAFAQSPRIVDSVLLVGTLIVEPTRLPESLQEFSGRVVFLPVAFGSGFVVRKDGYVVTALHVIRRAESRLGEIRASFKWLVVCTTSAAGLYHCKEAIVVGVDDLNDLAVLKITRLKGDTLPALPLTSKKPAQGTEVWAAGYPGGTLSVAAGTFSDVSNTPADNTATRSDGLWFAAMTIEKGTSGGPIYMRDGSVIGVMVARSDSQAVAGFVPAQHVIDLLARSGVALHAPFDAK
jgi:S1-C subfamily serine protease